MLAATELTDGVWYPVGGFQKIRDALKSIAEKNGVNVRTQTEVSKIIVEEEPVPGEVDQTRKVVKGVQLKSGEVIESDLVVANPDTPYVFDELLDFPEADKEAQKLDQGEYSCGMIEFNFALKVILCLSTYQLCGKGLFSPLHHINGFFCNAGPSGGPYTAQRVFVLGL